MVDVVRSKDLSLEIGGKTLIHDISVQVSAGQLVAIVGPSGAGKSTLLKMLCGLRTPSHGKAFLQGQPALETGRSPDRVGYVPQDDIIHNSLSVDKVLYYAAALRLPQLSPEQQKQRVDEVLDMLGLAARRRLKVRKLSGGQRKRVSIAVELLAQPQALFLDEPTSGLDPGLEKSLTQTLRQLAQGPRGIILSTHIMESLSLVDQLWVVFDGHLAFSGPPDVALSFFRVERLRDIFDQLPKRKPEAWARAARDLPQAQIASSPTLPPRGHEALPQTVHSNGQQAPQPQANPPPLDPAQNPRVDPVVDPIEAQLRALKKRIREDVS